MGQLATGVIIFLVILGVIIIANAIRIVREYERLIVFFLGKLRASPRGPGLVLIWPIVEQARKVDLRVLTFNVPRQEVVTKDNVTVTVDAVCYFRVIDPNRAIVEVEDYILATSQKAQTTLRSVLGQHELDELLSEREKLNTQLQRIIDADTEPWGIKVTAVEVRDVQLPDNMQRAIARQAEAERERRAKIIHAEGEFTASQRLSDAARILTTTSGGLQLRYLQTLTEIASERNSTVIFPIPIDLIQAFIRPQGDSGPPRPAS